MLTFFNKLMWILAGIIVTFGIMLLFVTLMICILFVLMGGTIKFVLKMLGCGK